jgi:dolichol-phosphate mannosyltransferase
MQKKISFVLPIYNEEGNIPLMYTQLCEVVLQLEKDFEIQIVLVNDGSRDQSWPLLEKLVQHDERITAINLSRNFGHQLALTAGYDHASGDAVITMDADLQDPPHLVLQMIDKWLAGADIVYARRADRTDGFLKKLTADLYYRFLDTISDVRIPRYVGDFRLIDKKVLSFLQTSREKSRYLRGMVAWAGFKQEFIDFKRPNRHAGVTGYTWSKMIKLAFDGMTGFSLFPLRVAAFVGLFVVLSGAGMFFFMIADMLIYAVSYPLFKWLAVIMYLFMGLQFLLLWIVGEYIGRIFEQQKGRPLYLISGLAKDVNCVAQKGKLDEARIRSLYQ